MLLKFFKTDPQKLIFPYFYTKISISLYTTTSSTTATGTPTSLMVDYLIKTLGFTEKEAIVTSTKLTPLKSTKKPDSVVHFLTTKGFKQTHIKKIVSNVPMILTFDVDKTLRPKFKAFNDVGIAGSDLVDILSLSDVLKRSLDGHIRPTLEVLRSVFGIEKDGRSMFIIKALKRSSWMLAPCVRASLPVSYSLLQSYGLSVEKIQILFLRRTRYLIRDPKWVQYVLTRVEEHIGIPRESGMFVHGVCALCVVSDESLKARFNVFKSLGFSDHDITTLARKNPYTLTLAEPTIRKKVLVLINELGCTPAWIAGRPSVLAYSFEKRVMPRYVVIKVLKEKELLDSKCNLFSYLHVNNSRFIKQFLLPYKNKVPDLYDDFVRNANVPQKVAS